MQDYQLVLNVPDDFDPLQLDVELSYPEAEIGIAREAFDVTVSELSKKIIENCKLDLTKITENSVVIFKFPQSLAVEAGPQFIKQIQLELEANLHCTVLGLVDDIDLLVENSAEAVKLLEGMLAKVKSKSIIKLV